MGDHVFLKVMLRRRVVKFSKRGKLSPRFIGAFKVLERVGTVAYRLVLPSNLSGVHAVFHVSMLGKCGHLGIIIHLILTSFLPRKKSP